MSFLSIIAESRPRMDVSSSQKGRTYHRRMGRADRASVSTGIIQRFQAKSILAEKAYNDEIWTQEDIDTFLLDEDGKVRNRVTFGFNMVKPLVEQYRGGVIQMDFNATLQPISKRSLTHRQRAAERRQILHSLSELSPEMSRIIRRSYNLGETMEETISIVNNSWQDGMLKAMNHLLEKMVVISGADQYKGEDGFRFALTGLLADIYVTKGLHPYWDKVHGRDFFWDTNFQMPDMSDASFMGLYKYRHLGEMVEMYDISKEEVSDIQSSIRQHSPIAGNTFNLENQTKVRVLEDYWKDVSFSEFGYVELDGIPTLVPIGFSESGEKPKYTKNDTVKPPDTDENRRTFSGNYTRKSFVEVTRFVKMALWEDMAGCSCEGPYDRKLYEEGELPDLVLDYGVDRLQEYNPLDTNFSRTPLKATIYACANGDIVSPAQAVLDPARFVARTLSALEGQMNMAGGKVMLVDMDLMDEKSNMKTIERTRKKGGTIGLRAGGRGVSNAVHQHDDSPGSGAYAMLNIVAAVQDMVRSITGISSTMSGEGQKDLGKGVAELLVQRGVTMQESFYDAWANHQMQKYRAMVTSGKQWYVKHPDVLIDLISEESFRHMVGTEDFELERWNIALKRDNAERVRRTQANQWLDWLVQMQLIDRKLYFELYNQAFVEDIAPELRRYTAMLEMAENQARKDQARQEMMAGIMAQQQQLDNEDNEMIKMQAQSAAEIAKEGAKERKDVTRENVRAQNAMAAREQEARDGLDVS